MTLAAIPDGFDALLALAEAAAANAYAPYSGFHVGAAVRAASGTVYAAGNMENASFAVTQCAEANAVAAMVAAGERAIAGVAVTAWRASDPNAPVVPTPCGRCRQIINEFAARDVLVVAASRDRTQFVAAPLSLLLPFAFGPASLG